MIKAFFGAIAVLLAAAGTAAGPALRASSTPGRVSFATSFPPSFAPAWSAGDGASSTPGVFVLPQLGSVSFRCGRRWSVQPFFDMRFTLATDEVTIRAGAVTRRNYTHKVVGRLHGRPLIEEEFSRAPELALPFGRYRTVTFGIRQATEPHEIDATLTSAFGACYVKRWLVRMNVSPN